MHQVIGKGVWSSLLWRRLLLVSSVAMLTACATTRAVVEVDPAPVQQPIAATTYTVVVEQMPSFLVPFMRDELVAALAARGATEVADNGDVEFRLRFEQVTLLAAAVPSGDQPTGTVTPESATRFLPRVELLALKRGDSAAVSVGKISRLHSVAAGVYMHAEARPAIRRAFDELLEHFLAR
jgi:hypothetical protein